MACRNKTKATAAANDIKDSCKSKQNLGELVVTELDLSSLKSVKNCAKIIMDQENKIDLLINNAGVMTCPESRTEDRFEMQFGTNHLGHFLFTLLLLPKIAQSPSARIVNVSSRAHERGTIDFNDLNWNNKPYSALKAYAQSKLANILFTMELARQLAEANMNHITVYSLHPGVIKTELGRHLKDTYGAFLVYLWDLCQWAIKTPEQGAQTTIYCSVDEKCATESGLYYADCVLKKPSKAARNKEDAKRLWIESLKLVDLPDNYMPFNKI
ncbi:retinol dehydrogenase 13-like isoform X2 [Euwallacea fornicatus]